MTKSRKPHRPITIDGRTQGISAWAEESPVSRQTISTRLARGWDPESAVFTPETRPVFPREHFQRMSRKANHSNNGGQQIPLSKRIRIYFLAHPNTSNREVGEALSIDPRTVAKYRDPNSAATRIKRKRFIHILFVVGEEQASKAIKRTKHTSKPVELFRLVRANMSVQEAANRLGVPFRTAHNWVDLVIKYWKDVPDQKEGRG